MFQVVCQQWYKILMLHPVCWVCAARQLVLIFVASCQKHVTCGTELTLFFKPDTWYWPITANAGGDYSALIETSKMADPTEDNILKLIQLKTLLLLLWAFSSLPNIVTLTQTTTKNPTKLLSSMEDSLDEAILTICLCDLRLCHIYGMAQAELLCECCLYVTVSAYIDSMYLSWCLLCHWHLPVYLKMLPVCDSPYSKKILKKTHIRPWIIIPLSNPESLHHHQTMNYPNKTHMTLIHYDSITRLKLM